MSNSIPSGARLQCFEVVGNGGPGAPKGAFFIRKVDAERFALSVNRDVREAFVTDRETIDYLLGPRSVPDALWYFLKKGIMQPGDLTIEDSAAIQRAFGALS